jgi:hypothetical protein
MQAVQGAVKARIERRDCRQGQHETISCNIECGGSGGCTPPNECRGACLDNWISCQRRVEDVNRDIDQYNRMCAVEHKGNDLSNKKAKNPEAINNREREKEFVHKARETAASEREREFINHARQDAAAQRKQAQWHCYGVVGNPGPGFRRCQEECGHFHARDYCYHACFSTGKSLANGQSCFIE